MTLESLLRAGRLSEHDAAGDEISRLLDSAERALRDAGTDGLGADSRLGLAYRRSRKARSPRCSPTATEPRPAIPRTSSSSSSRSSRPAASPRAACSSWKRCAPRDRSESSGVPVSDAVAEEGIDAARELIASVRDWIPLNRPDLVSAAA